MHSNDFVRAVLLTATSLGFATDSSSSSGTYALADDLSYHNFFNSFQFNSWPDATKGFVQFMNESSAISMGLVGYLDDTKSIFMGADHKWQDPRGRHSVRLESWKTWNYGLLVADIRHMPASTCGSWPAFWLLSATEVWPQGEEVDILEGLNDYQKNAVMLHTSEGCKVDNATNSFCGTMMTSNCDVKVAERWLRYWRANLTRWSFSWLLWYAVQSSRRRCLRDAVDIFFNYDVILPPRLAEHSQVLSTGRQHECRSVAVGHTDCALLWKRLRLLQALQGPQNHL